MLLVTEALDRQALRWDGDGWHSGIPECVGRLKGAATVEQNRDAWNVQRCCDPAGDRLEERPGLHHCPDLGREIAEDRVGLISLAEKTAVDPKTKAIREPAADRDDRRHPGHYDRDLP